MEKESIKMFFESQSTPPDSEKIEQWYIDNINNTELDTILLELLKKCTHQDEQKARCAFSRTCHRIGIGSPKVTQKRKYNIPLDIGNSSYRIGMRFPIGYTFMEFPVRRYQFGKGIRIGRQFKDGDTSRLYKGLPQTHKYPFL